MTEAGVSLCAAEVAELAVGWNEQSRESRERSGTVMRRGRRGMFKEETERPDGGYLIV